MDNILNNQKLTCSSQDQLLRELIHSYDEYYHFIEKKIIKSLHEALVKIAVHAKTLMKDSNSNTEDKGMDLPLYLRECNDKLMKVESMVDDLVRFSDMPGDKIHIRREHSETLNSSRIAEIDTCESPEKPLSSTLKPSENRIPSGMEDSSPEVLRTEQQDPQKLDLNESPLSIQDLAEKKIEEDDKAVDLTLFEDGFTFYSDKDSSVEPIYRSVLADVIVREDNLVECCVSDVVDPTRFSVQIEQFTNDISKFETHLADIYSSPTSNKLTFDVLPPVGCICVALYTLDNNWYRGRVMKHVGEQQCEILYVDYGNDAVVKLSQLRRIKPSLLKLPFQSVLCSLCDVQPTTPSTKEPRKWKMQDRAIFDELVFGKTFFAAFKTNHTFLTKPVLVKLYLKSVDATEAVNISDLEDLSNSMIEKGIAAKRPSRYPSGNSDMLQLKSVPPSPKKEDDQHKVSDSSDQHTCVKDNSVTEKKIQRSEMETNTEKSEMETNIEKSEMETNTEKSETEVKKTQKSETENTQEKTTCETSSGLDEATSAMASWDPMKEDYNATRNNKRVDVDNACVAVEGVDYDKVEVCPHFLKNACWYGENCTKLHSKEGETKAPDLMFWHHDLQQFPLQPEQQAVVKVKSIASHQFHVQVFYNFVPQNPIVLRNTPEQLINLESQMRNYYINNAKKGPTLCSSLSRGQMFVYECTTSPGGMFYRVSIKEVLVEEKSAIVFMVDYGMEARVSCTNLLYFCQEFRSLPQQSVVCEVAQDSLSPVCLAQNDIYEVQFKSYRVEEIQDVTMYNPSRLVAGLEFKNKFNFMPQMPSYTAPPPPPPQPVMFWRYLPQPSPHPCMYPAYPGYPQ